MLISFHNFEPFRAEFLLTEPRGSDIFWATIETAGTRAGDDRAMIVPHLKELRPAYGFDDVAIVPGDVTVNPELSDASFALERFRFGMPVLAADLDAVVDPRFAVAFHQMGGLAFLNLEGLQTRYSDPDAALAEILSASDEDATAVIQKVYSQPIREELIGERIGEIKAGGAVCAVSATPANTKRLAPVAVEAGADILRSKRP